MLRRGERVAMGDVKLIVVDIVEEHIDAAQVVGSDIDLLPVKALPHMIAAQNLSRLEQQRTRTAGWVVDLVDLRFSVDGNARQQLRHLLRREVFAAALARVGGVHAHQVLISITESVDGVVLIAAQLHIADAVHQLDKALVALGDRATQLVAVHVHIVEQALEVVLAVASLGRVLNGGKDGLQRLIEVFVLWRVLADVGKQLTRQDEKALGTDQVLPRLLSIPIRQISVVEGGIARLALACVDVVGKVF